MELFAEHGQRQADAFPNHSHMMERPFHRDRIRFEEQLPVKRHEQFVQTLGFFTISGNSGFAQLGHCLWGDVRGDGHVALGTSQHKFRCRCVIT